MNVSKHYDKLIDENNDPMLDPPQLQEYMNKWDGQIFIDKMNLDTDKTVLEIGIGTGRIAIKVLPLCKKLYGIDISAKTINRAAQNLFKYSNVEFIRDDFMKHKFKICFDIIYSTLTFMHIKEKQKFINKVYKLLNENGFFVLSIDKNQKDIIEYNRRKIKIYPDNKCKTVSCIVNSRFKLLEIIETELAYIFVCHKTLY